MVEQQTSFDSHPLNQTVESSVLQQQSDPDHLLRNHLFGLDMPVDIISVLYASTVALGGIVGFATKGSVPSLAAGLTFGIVLGFGAYQTSVNPRNYALITGTSAILAGMMGYRFYKSGKFMPAGLIFTLSSLIVLRFAVRFLTGRNYI